MRLRSFRFLLSRRWLGFVLVVAVFAVACWWLGEWQFHRLHNRLERNQLILERYDGPAVDLSAMLADGQPMRSHEWQHVSVRGRYSDEPFVTVLYQSRKDDQGVDELAVFVTDDGDRVLVDRGWLFSPNHVSDPQPLPDPPAGEVTITGWVRTDGTGSSTTVHESPVGLVARSVSSAAVAEALGVDLEEGFIDLEGESPASAAPMVPRPKPELGQGPHFFYGLQWWFFGVMAVGGIGWLGYQDWREYNGVVTESRRAGPGTGSRRGPRTDRPA